VNEPDIPAVVFILFLFHGCPKENAEMMDSLKTCIHFVADWFFLLSA
jgi:hypothetical protein